MVRVCGKRREQPQTLSQARRTVLWVQQAPKQAVPSQDPSLSKQTTESQKSYGKIKMASEEYFFFFLAPVMCERANSSPRSGA